MGPCLTKSSLKLQISDLATRCSPCELRNSTRVRAGREWATRMIGRASASASTRVGVDGGGAADDGELFEEYVPNQVVGDDVALRRLLVPKWLISIRSAWSRPSNLNGRDRRGLPMRFAKTETAPFCGGCLRYLDPPGRRRHSRATAACLGRDASMSRDRTLSLPAEPSRRTSRPGRGMAVSAASRKDRNRRVGESHGAAEASR